MSGTPAIHHRWMYFPKGRVCLCSVGLMQPIEVPWFHELGFPSQTCIWPIAWMRPKAQFTDPAWLRFRDTLLRDMQRTEGKPV